MKRFLALAQGLGFVPCRAPLLFLIRKNFLSYLFPLLPAEKFLYIITSREVFVLCSSFFWDKPVSQAHPPLTLPFSHFETQLVCLFWPRLQVSQLEDDQYWRRSEISWNLFRGVTYLWSVSAVSRSTINILMFLFPAVSCFWLWLHLICDVHLTLFSPDHVQHLVIYKSGVFQLVLSFCSPYWNLPNKRARFLGPRGPLVLPSVGPSVPR